MPSVNPTLHKRLQTKLGLSRRQVDRLITLAANQLLLPRNLAAISLAADSHVDISRIARPEELEAVRHAKVRTPAAPVYTSLPQPADSKSSRRPASVTRRRPRRQGVSVFVVHGRNEHLRKSLFRLLRSVALKPIEWRKAIELTGKPSPYVGEILDAAFSHAVAVVVLLSPDDEAKLRVEFFKQSDPDHEKVLTPQPRANVLFEAGMAFARNQNSTVLVQVGKVRPFSDIAGRHVVHLSNSIESRLELMTKLSNAGCIVDLSGTDWQSEGDFVT